MSKFHIHVDAKVVSPEFQDRALRHLRFSRSDFSGHPDGQKRYEPVWHLTRKLDNTAEFREAFTAVLSAAREPNAMEGYVEGEWIALDEGISCGRFDPTIVPPFQLDLGKLPQGCFRESEIHVTMLKEESDPRVIRALLEMGLFGAYLPKPQGTAMVFTLQGTRRLVSGLVGPLKNYLECVGGVKGGTIKEERIVRWWATRPDVKLPPVVTNVRWMQSSLRAL